MKKSILLLATCALVASTAALADTANVNVYGTINVSMEQARGLGSIDVDDNEQVRTRIVSNSSNFGIKGIEDLNNDLKGLFQVELDVNVATGALGANLRNTMIGLGTPYGSLHFGKWDSPFRALTFYMEPVFGAGVTEIKPILDTPGMGVGSYGKPTYYSTTEIDGYSFSRRQSNSLWYWSPKFYGMTAKVMFVPAAERADGIDPTMLSASLVYEEGPITAGFAYENHSELRNGSTKWLGANTAGQTDTSDTGLKATVGYKLMENTAINAAWSQLKYEGKVGTTALDYKRNSYFFTATHQIIEPITLRLGYGFASDGKGTQDDGTALDAKDTGAKMYIAGVSYSFSKRTDVYAMASRITNKNNGYTFIQNPVGTVAAGQDPVSFGLGVRHVF
ncbi:MAG: porin [Oligoflexia bacterium]|nr:porin [Oligoflexia bacterium]